MTELTVMIPTYNRNELLKTNLSRLLPQLDRRCRLLICDNNSTTPVASTLAEVLAAYPDLPVVVHRNRSNLGATGNILRGFELCETEWIWLLGDDDAVTTNAVKVIWDEIERHPDAQFINFATPAVDLTQPVVTKGVTEFVGCMDSLSNTMCISAGVYRIMPHLDVLRLGYHYAYSMVPHVAMVLAALGERGEAVYSAGRVIDGLAVGGLWDRWSHLDLALGVFTLTELPIPISARKSLAREIGSLRLMESTTYQLLGMRRKGMTFEEASCLFDAVVGHRLWFERGLEARMRRGSFRALLGIPRVGLWAFQTIKRLRGRSGDQLVIPGRYDRTE